MIHGAEVNVAEATEGCTHESSSGVDQNFGPDKVWACDSCGWRHRTAVENGIASDVAA